MRHRIERSYFLVAGLFIVFSAILKVQTLRFPHSEPDELIFWQLAKNLVSGHGYTLQGTKLLLRLSPFTYNHPLFNHPPLFPALLVPFVVFGSPQSAVLISWVGHFLCILAVAVIAKHLIGQRCENLTALSPRYWLPLLGVSADPLLNFISGRLWIDSILTGLVAMAMSLFIASDCDRFRRATLLAGGLLLGLAALAKLTALIAVPVALYCVLAQTARPWKERIQWALCSMIPVGLLVAPWLILFYVRTGAVLPGWVKPDDWAMQHYPFVRAAVNRSVDYYPVKLCLIVPLVVVLILPLPEWRRIWRTDLLAREGLLWFTGFFFVITLLGVSGIGYQMRFLGPCIPAIYVTLFAYLSNARRGVQLLELVAALCISFSLFNAAPYLLTAQDDEIWTVSELYHFPVIDPH
jgi:4-amino-4-deoxy-L-arabinose transferase-like glycosyltransferase